MFAVLLTYLPASSNILQSCVSTAQDPSSQEPPNQERGHFKPQNTSKILPLEWELHRISHTSIEGDPMVQVHVLHETHAKWPTSK